MSSSLLNTRIVAVDCQTTGATPRRGRLLELGWGTVDSPSGKTKIESALVRLPKDENLPNKIKQLTNIDPNELADAPTELEVWRRFRATACETRQDADCLIAAHYAVFERRFLEHLHEQYDKAPCSFTLVCTYELSRRLMPNLPKHSLRAVAGHLGYRLPKARRAGPHVDATLQVWRHLAELLESAHGITTLDRLLEFVTTPSPAANAKKQYALPASRLKQLPTTPGVYRFLDRAGTPLYIGKATNLRQRVSSYFQSPKQKPPHIREMVAQAHDVRVHPCNTPLEAALTELDAIKQDAPEYNRALNRPALPLWFAAGDFSDIDTAYDAIKRPLGPFPRRDPLALFSAVYRAIANAPRTPDNGRHELYEWFEQHRREVSDSAVDDGISRFRRLVEYDCSGCPSVAGVLAWGLLAAPSAKDNGEETVSTDLHAANALQIDDDEAACHVARSLCGIARHVAHLWWRGEWLKWISESCVAFASPKHPDLDGRRLLRIQNGRIIEAESIDRGCELPCPAGAATTTAERCRDLNNVWHDRLRVLTTELKKVLSDGGTIEVRVSSDRLWDTRRVGHILETV